MARSVFSRASFDLIYARPGQTPEMWKAELAEALALQPSHLSLYQLTIEDGTPFARLHKAGKLIIPVADDAHELYNITQQLTEAAGLPAYEISNHSVPGQECRHNLLYWRYGTYAGIGPGAHGRLQIGARRHAISMERNPERWCSLVEAKGSGIIESQILSRVEEADERLLMGLRLSEGLDLTTFGRSANLALKSSTVHALVSAGFLERRGSRIIATRSGRLVLNRVVLELSNSLSSVDIVPN
jgi:oxygen-independent coproporphyrinogen-3 oxidase